MTISGVENEWKIGVQKRRRTGNGLAPWLSSATAVSRTVAKCVRAAIFGRPVVPDLALDRLVQGPPVTLAANGGAQQVHLLDVTLSLLRAEDLRRGHHHPGAQTVSDQDESRLLGSRDQIGKCHARHPGPHLGHRPRVRRQACRAYEPAEPTGPTKPGSSGYSARYAENGLLCRLVQSRCGIIEDLRLSRLERSHESVRSK